LPPEIIDVVHLLQGRKLAWYDRPELWQAIAAAEQSEGEVVTEDRRQLMEEAVANVWVGENLATTVSRYLNSG